jgi:hypothetical protein
MSMRIQVVLEKGEREAFRAAAHRDGQSLSAWMKACAREKLSRMDRRELPRTVDELRVFFAACDERERGVEPDWSEHRQVIERAATSGAGDS